MSLSRRLHRSAAQLATRHLATAAGDVWPGIIATLDAGEADAAAAEHLEWAAVLATVSAAWKNFAASVEVWRVAGGDVPTGFHQEASPRHRALLLCLLRPPSSELNADGESLLEALQHVQRLALGDPCAPTRRFSAFSGGGPAYL
jgi:hypothetical protein